MVCFIVLKPCEMSRQTQYKAFYLVLMPFFFKSIKKKYLPRSDQGLINVYKKLATTDEVF